MKKFPWYLILFLNITMLLAVAQNLGVAVPNSVPNATGPSAAAWTTTPTVAAVIIAGKCAANSSSGTVACGASASGYISCDTGTSAGTCTVNSTAILATSAPWVQPTAGAGALLSVTCNTVSDTGLTGPRLFGWTAGSLVISMGTFTAHPECFTWGIN